jgi:hypothetical protein
MFFVCTVAGGSALAMPDTCQTPAPPGPPVPMPYPNTATLNMATGFAPTVMVANMPALNVQSIVPLTAGDEAGTVGGVVSGMIKGPAKFVTSSVKVQIGGQPCVRLTDTTAHNGTNPNAPAGNVIAPSQTKVLAG